MFGERCYGKPGCGHTTNWTCPCTCDEIEDYPAQEPIVKSEELSILDRLAPYLSHHESCRANDMDYLDNTPCTCGLREIYSPKGIHP